MRLQVSVLRSNKAKSRLSPRWPCWPRQVKPKSRFRAPSGAGMVRKEARQW
jgi:hypothetical protein